MRELISADRWKNPKNRKTYNPQKIRATRYHDFEFLNQTPMPIEMIFKFSLIKFFKLSFLIEVLRSS